MKYLHGLGLRLRDQLQQPAATATAALSAAPVRRLSMGGPGAAPRAAGSAGGGIVSSAVVPSLLPRAALGVASPSAAGAGAGGGGAAAGIPKPLSAAEKLRQRLVSMGFADGDVVACGALLGNNAFVDSNFAKARFASGVHRLKLVLNLLLPCLPVVRSWWTCVRRWRDWSRWAFRGTRRLPPSRFVSSSQPACQPSSMLLCPRAGHWSGHQRRGAVSGHAQRLNHEHALVLDQDGDIFANFSSECLHWFTAFRTVQMCTTCYPSSTWSSSKTAWFPRSP